MAGIRKILLLDFQPVYVPSRRVRLKATPRMPQAGSRKRPAPGASPIVEQPAMNYSAGASQLPNDQYLRWGQSPQLNGGSGYPDPTGCFNPNLYNGVAQPQEKTTQTSNQLTKRPANQQLVTRAGFSSANNDAWPTFGEGITQQPEDEAWINEDEELERKALIAKRDAQAKRKPLPPFVQKLSR